MKDNSRNFYEELFSPDTTDKYPEDLHEFSESISNMEQEYIFSGISLVDNGKNKNPSNTSPATSFNQLRPNIDKAASHCSGSDMDISTEHSSISTSICNSSSIHSSDFSLNSNNISQDNTPSRSLSESTQSNGTTISPVISFLDEDDISKLLGENVPLPEPTSRETLEKHNVDTIASFNVRNKYNHITAGELLIREKLTFLSIQEPYASSNKSTESWKAFQKIELQSARISCYETPYQIILFDSWKWGGRTLCEFQSLQYGRIASIAFDLGNNLKLGIISIYAPTKSSKDSDLTDTSCHPSMKITNNLVQKILNKWKSKFPTMVTMILGDLQETIGSSNRDNLGNYRQEPSQDGVLMGLSTSHKSIVREMNPDIPYVTRFGKEGARGIDHIFFPSDDNLNSLCTAASIQRDIGANYFPSDHSLLTCSISRESQNNNCGGLGKDTYAYNKLFNIKLKQSGPLGVNLDFDSAQFKECKKFKEQSHLYNEIQKVTGTDSYLTKNHLNELDLRADLLFKSLWENGLDQNINGAVNRLVQIEDSHAAEISYILNKFNASVKQAMEDLKLGVEKNSNETAGKTRGRLRKRSGFKIFNNLPVPTKLRYLKTNVESKLKEVSKNIYWLDEFRIREIHGDENTQILSQNDFWTQWNKILNNDGIVKKAKEVAEAYGDEGLERQLHMDAINYESNKGKHKKDTKNAREPSSAGNTLPFVPDNVTRLLNFWLSNSRCNQGFSSTTSEGNSTAFLTVKVNDWVTQMMSLDVNDFDVAIPHQFKLLKSCLETAQSDLHKFCNQIIKLQSFYRQATLDYFLESNNIGNFTNKVSHKSRQAPAAHTSIWDSNLMDFRTCTDELEELRATSAFHGTWMANSEAQETCAFAKIVKKGRLGNRGIKLFPDRVVTMQDIGSLIHKGNSLPRRLKKAFLQAHRSHTANLFREPKTDRSEFFYPFYLLNEQGRTMNDDDIEEKLWKAISSIPTKARFEGFQLAVIGRFGHKWRQLLLKIVKLILVMRYVPPCLKKMARFPIPKPGKHNEYRPISLCHDLYCYIMGIVTSYSSAAIDKAGILHEGLTAYQKGKGCANLVTTELCFREDCLENHVPSVQIDEDEEKFFDRIPVEILLAAMRVNGFPEQGYIEIKASAMESKTVEIITAKGVTYARFICGLEQGNPDSPTISNLVIKFKHDIWKHISNDIQTILNKNGITGQEGYYFKSMNKKDGQVYLCKIGYSDDNSKYISVSDEKDLLSLVKYFTQLSGDLSMVTKIGRKSAKCEIQFFNISAELTIKMQKVWSTAWSFVDDSPIEEQIPFKIHMKASEFQKFYKLSGYFDLSEEDQIAWNKIIGNVAHKHLGLSCTLGADTSTAWRKTIEKMKEKVIKLNLYKMQSSAQKKCFNMLVGTIPTFAPVQMNFPSQELVNFDKYAATICLKSNGLSKSDTKLRLFLPEKMGGLGFLSTSELDLISVAREFEVISNNITLDSRAFRTRISALDDYPLHATFLHKNHAREAIVKLARFGIYVRDSDEGIINNILSDLSTTSKIYIPCTHQNYKDSCTIGIGIGKERNTELMYGGPIHSILQLLQENKWKSNKYISLAAKKCHVSTEKLISLYSKALTERNKKFEKFSSVWEWRNRELLQVNSIPEHCREWNYKTCALREFSDGEILEEQQMKSLKSMNFQWNKYVRITDNSQLLEFNTYEWEGQFLQFLMSSESPIMIATDGAHEKKENQSSISTSSFVLSVLDIRKGESLKSREWEDRAVIPLMSRISILPTNFGTCETDIAHGEFCALLMAEIAFTSLPRVTISDSKAIREQVLKMRKLDSETPDRHYLRSIAGGIGKFVSGIMKTLLFNSKNLENTFPKSKAMEIIYKILQDRNKSFLDIARTWTSNCKKEKDQELTDWEFQYYDDHVSKPLLKVNSHQLDTAGKTIKSPPRYKKLIPNLALLSANHHADICADYGKKFPHVPFQYDNPPSYLRFFFVCGGRHIDRHISDFCHEQFDLLKIRKLQLKKTQGLLWRVINFTTTSWEILQLHKGWLRSLLGLSSTHTRRIYKSEIYRECCEKVFIEKYKGNNLKIKEYENANLSQKVHLLSGCLWCKSKEGCNRKGNRNHALLSCEHDDLKSFRTKITNLIESKFRIFFLDLMKATNFAYVEDCLRRVEIAFLNMQLQNTGRLRSMDGSINNRYTSSAEILDREGLDCIQNALNSSKINICCEIFGLLPNSNGIEIHDDQIGLVDCPWLGLMPRQIDDILIAQCNKTRNFVMHKETADTIVSSLTYSWNELKNLIMGRAIGAHRIICSTGKQIEGEWRKTFEIETNSIRKLKKEINNAPTANSNTLIFSKAIKKRTYETCRGIAVVRERKRSKIGPGKEISKPLKPCNGITCDHKCKGWYPNSKFSINDIISTSKQCQRCSRYMTALRKTKIILQDISKGNNDESILKFMQFIQENCDNMKCNYSALVLKLKSLLKFSATINLEEKSRNKVSDSLKLTCNLLSISIHKATHNFTINEIQCIQSSISLINSALLCKESDFSLDREAETKIQLLTSNYINNNCEKQHIRVAPIMNMITKTNRTGSNQLSSISTSTNIGPVNPPPLREEQPHTSKAKLHLNTEHVQPSSNTKKPSSVAQKLKYSKSQPLPSVMDAPKVILNQRVALKEFAAGIIRPRRYMKGMEMTKAIEVIRSFKTPHLYIASAEAANQISSWQLNQDWTSFAKMFGSRELIDNKLHGTYLIPLFSGDTTSGHWSLCVVQKLGRRNMRAWCMDSLGKGSINANIKLKIETAFAPGRATLTWQNCRCRCQEEVECGPRTVLAMWLIQQNLAENVLVEECVQIATLNNAPYHNHTSGMIREKIAYLVNRFTPPMITPPIRLRNRLALRRNRRPVVSDNIRSDHSCIVIN